MRMEAVHIQQYTLLIGNNMNNENMIEIINEKIDILSKIIDNLSYGIDNILWDQSKGIDKRQLELSDYILKKQALIDELYRLQDSGII